MEPVLFRESREWFEGIAVSPEDGIVTYLNRQGFNPNAVRPAAKAFLKTNRYLEEIGGSDSHGGRSVSGADLQLEHDPPARVFGGASVGDLVQWESGGTLQLEKAARVRAIADAGDWVFVENSETGIPMSEVIVEEKSSALSAKPPTMPMAEPAAKGTRREVFGLDEGDVVLIVPDKLSAASYDDLKSYLELFLRKAKRRAGGKAAD